MRRSQPSLPEGRVAPAGAKDREAAWFDYNARGISPARQRLDAVGLWIIEPVAAGLGHLAAWVRRHWLLVCNVANLVLFLGTFASPVLQVLGWPVLARAIFTAYHVLCLQRPTHSFFLWGYPMGMEQRMVAIPAAMALVGLAYALWPHRGTLRPLNAWLFLAGSAPLLVDVFSQTLGWRDSTALWRVSTGVLFGLVSVWLFYPLFAWAWDGHGVTRKVKLRLAGSWHR